MSDLPLANFQNHNLIKFDGFSGGRQKTPLTLLRPRDGDPGNDTIVVGNEILKLLVVIWESSPSTFNHAADPLVSFAEWSERTIVRHKVSRIELRDSIYLPRVPYGLGDLSDESLVRFAHDVPDAASRLYN